MNHTNYVSILKTALSSTGSYTWLRHCWLLLLPSLFLAGCGAPKIEQAPQPLSSASRPQQPPAAISTVIVRFKGLPNLSSASRMFDKQLLHVVNLDHNFAQTWRFVEDGWVAANVLPGRYLISRWEGNAEQHTLFVGRWYTLSQDIRTELAVPEPDTSIFFGTIDLSGVDITITKDGLDDARAFYARFAPGSSRPLVNGELKRTY